MFYKLAALVVLVSGFSHADVFISSVSSVSNLRTSLCTGASRAYLHRVCVVDGVAASTAAVYNSSFTLTGKQNLTGVIDGSDQGCLDFQLAAPEGLYRDQFGTAVYNVIYDCY